MYWAIKTEISQKYIAVTLEFRMYFIDLCLFMEGRVFYFYLNHELYSNYRKMAVDVGEHIDIIVGGHSHSLLWNGTEAPSNEVIAGPYPVFMESDSKPEHKVRKLK